MKKKKIITLLILSMCIFSSCNKDNYMSEYGGEKNTPEHTLSVEEKEYLENQPVNSDAQPEPDPDDPFNFYVNPNHFNKIGEEFKWESQRVQIKVNDIKIIENVNEIENYSPDNFAYETNINDEGTFPDLMENILDSEGKITDTAESETVFILADLTVKSSANHEICFNSNLYTLGYDGEYYRFSETKQPSFDVNTLSYFYPAQNTEGVDRMNKFFWYTTEESGEFQCQIGFLYGKKYLNDLYLTFTNSSQYDYNVDGYHFIKVT